MERHRFAVIVVDAVEKDRVHVRVQSQVRGRPLHDEHRSALSDHAVIISEPPAIKRQHRIGELPDQCTRVRTGHSMARVIGADLRRMIGRLIVANFSYGASVQDG